MKLFDRVILSTSEDPKYIEFWPVISKAWKKLFNVKVREVRTMIIHGKFKRIGRTQTKRANWKKAYVTLSEGQKIDFFQTK